MLPFDLPSDYTPQKRVAVERRIQQVVELLADRQNVLLLMHNDPDPDALASARALEVLLHHYLPDANLTLAHGGMIGRAENRTMSDLFVPHAIHISTAEAADTLPAYDAIALVDTQPTAGNHLLYGIDYPLDDVILAIDHHPPKRSQTRAVVHDVRPEIGACCTILCEYLAVAELTPEAKLATALFYGIKSDTRGLSRHTTDLDIWAYTMLRNLVDTEVLGRIEHVELPRSYYRGLSDALANTMLYVCPDKTTMPDSAAKAAKETAEVDAASGPASNNPDAEEEQDDEIQPCEGDVAVSLLFDMQRPDMAGEVADLLLRLEDVSWAICLGIYDERLVISVRTDAASAQAGRIVRAIVGRSGTAGGHDTMAGGRIHLPDDTPAERVAALHGLVPRFLHELGVGDVAGEPLLEKGS